MVTKELLKSEIEKVQDQYLGVLYRIIKALEEPGSGSGQPAPAAWRTFVSETYGSTAGSPIERGPQGDFEVRESFR